MTKIYLYSALAGLFLTVFLFGHSIGVAKCRQEFTTQSVALSQEQNVKKEAINAEIYRTGVRDIRRVLREKYTIAD